jgi:DNA-binding NtrC family response regulator
MPLHLQPKLLRALQEREFERLGESRSVQVDIRVIATTNVSLAAMVERGQFRGDLYYRLNVIPLSLPPLRDRREDIPILAQHFAEKYAAQMHLATPRLRPDFLERLQSHTWPGNVRELANFMRRVLTLSGTLDLDAGCFEMEFHGSSKWLASIMVQPQRRLRSQALRSARWNGCTWKALWPSLMEIARMPPKCSASACARCATKFGSTVSRPGGMHNMAAPMLDAVARLSQGRHGSPANDRLEHGERGYARAITPRTSTSNLRCGKS